MADESRSDGRQDGERARVVKHHRLRRQLLKSLAAGGVVAGTHVLPDRWVKPVVDQIVVPAHAQASGLRMETSLGFTVTEGDIGGVLGPGTTTIDDAFDHDEIAVNLQARLTPPPVPGQNVHVTFVFDAGGGDATFAQGQVDAVSDPSTGDAFFDPSVITLDDLGVTSDLNPATLTATFSSTGVPDVVVQVDFGF